MARYKEEGNLKALLVAGCLAQRYKQEILDEIPEVDAILGTTSYEEVAKVLDEVLRRKNGTHLSCFHDLSELPRRKSDVWLPPAAIMPFWKIAEGCDKRCTYCIIPIKGTYAASP